MKTKLKVVWLCHFSNEEVQKHLKPRRRINSFALWISSSYDILRNDTDIELHIISPHRYITGVKSFQQDGISFYFYNAHMPIFGRSWPAFLKWDYISNFRKSKILVKRIVQKIKPDIIHLHGAENAYYSSTFLPFIGKYATILTIQGFISKASDKSSRITKKRIEIEQEILSKVSHAFYRTKTMGGDLKEFNPNIHLYWSTYPKKLPKPYPSQTKEYDLVFFARVSRDKGIFDLLEAIVYIKKTSKKNISLLVLGGDITEDISEFCRANKIVNNIIWKGFQPSIDNVHKFVSKADVCVLPTYHDIVSGTILESLLLRVPVVAYNVGSIHEINQHQEIISLVEKYDVYGLAESILYLLNNNAVRKERAERGYNRIHELFIHSDKQIKDSLLHAYNEVINNFSINSK
jgi:glycosyltransferase involved in cell wall biosynthesis